MGVSRANFAVPVAADRRGGRSRSRICAAFFRLRRELETVASSALSAVRRRQPSFHRRRSEAIESRFQLPAAFALEVSGEAVAVAGAGAEPSASVSLPIRSLEP